MAMILIVGYMMFPNKVMAIGDFLGIGNIAQSAVNSAIANGANFFLAASSWFVAITGAFLSISINITTHIGMIYETVTGIKSVWIVIRDLSSIFIIFALLYFSIKTIIGRGGNSLNELIIKIFLAGVLINFSLFFVRVAIDASNIISLQFYEAIAPETSQNWTVSQAINDGGLSNVFMQSLKIPKIYESKDALKGTDVAAGIGFAMIGGILVMITAGLSFLAAGIAFTARTAILLFVMALSPLFFVGMIFPEIKAKTKKLSDALYSQCVFMPVYLFLMYVSLRIISDSGFMNIFNQNATGITGGGVLSSTFIGVIIQYTIALFFINLPLVAAIELGGMGMKWAPQAGGIGKWLGGKVGGFAGKNTVGWAGSKLDKYFEGTKGGNNMMGRAVRDMTTTKLANLKFGGSTSRKDDEKLGKEIKKKGREISNIENLDRAISTGNNSEIKRILSSMSNSEIASLDTKKHLTNENIVSHLSSSIYSSIEKGDKSDKDKVEIGQARTKALGDVVDKIASGTATPEDYTKVRSIMKNMSGNDLEKIISERPSGAAIKPEFIEHIKPSQLKDMEGLDDTSRRMIGTAIDNWKKVYGANHPAYDYINKNRTLWT